MSSCDMLAQAGGKGFLALAIVQLLGVVLAIGLTFYIADAHNCTIPKRWHNAMMLIVGAVLVLTVAVAACQKDLAPKLWVDVGGPSPGPDFLRWFDFNTAHLIYFLVDFAALAFLIYATGGPQESLYATFLLVIVPISIALGKPSVTTVVAFAGITLFIFLTSLWAKPPKYFSASQNGNLVRKGWLGLVTTACVVFPTLVFSIQNYGRGDKDLVATTSTKLTSSTEEDENALQESGDRDLRAGVSP